MNEPDLPIFFGEWLKRRRHSLDLTQAELAARAGCSVFALRKIEAGERRPSRELAGLLADALEIVPGERPVFVRAARDETRSDRLPRVVLPPPVPLAAMVSPAAVRLRNWPAQPTSLVGREDEMAALGRLLRDPLCRLLTLIGPGGIGKTRLAVEVAAQTQAHFAGGVCFVPLAPLDTSAAVVTAIADALGFALQGQMEPQRQLLNHLANQHVLLVLDNAEHLLESAGLFNEILAQASGLKLLVTSRERLNLQSEWVFVTGWDIVRTLISLGDTCLALGHVDEARQVLLQARQVAQDAGVESLVLDAQTRLEKVVEVTAPAWSGG